MSPRILFRLGLRNLFLHKLRSTLSILGVLFGVAAVIAMSSVGEGARREAVQQVDALGIDSITLKARPPVEKGESVGLRLRDADAVRGVVPHVMAVAPVREASLEAEFSGRHDQVTVVGTTPDYQAAARLRVVSGRFLTALDVEDAKRVAVLGAFVAGSLFPFGDPGGETIRVGDDYFQVVGVLEGRSTAKGRASPIRTRDVNRALFVPLTALDRGKDTRPESVDEIVLRAADARYVVAAAEVAKAVAERSSAGAPFDVIVPREILRQKERTQRVFNVVTGVIAAISLLVGGIGIMNIMLASVAERTEEVGIRRALGARRQDIALQFLVESSILTTAGGAVGVALGLVGSFLIQRFASWPTALSPLMILLALLMAVGVGIGFGFYPAWRAAHLEPMEALRHG